MRHRLNSDGCRGDHEPRNEMLLQFMTHGPSALTINQGQMHNFDRCICSNIRKYNSLVPDHQCVRTTKRWEQESARHTKVESYMVPGVLLPVTELVGPVCVSLLGRELKGLNLPLSDGEVNKDLGILIERAV
jgi:hypothetical protein